MLSSACLNVAHLMLDFIVELLHELCRELANY